MARSKDDCAVVFECWILDYKQTAGRENDSETVEY